MSAASLLPDFGFVGIKVKGEVLGGIWEGESGSFMAMNGKLFSIAKGSGK